MQGFSPASIDDCCNLERCIFRRVNIKDYFLLQASNVNFYGILCVFPYPLMFEKEGDKPFIYFEKKNGAQKECKRNKKKMKLPIFYPYRLSYVTHVRLGDVTGKTCDSFDGTG